MFVICPVTACRLTKQDYLSVVQDYYYKHIIFLCSFILGFYSLLDLIVLMLIYIVVNIYWRDSLVTHNQQTVMEKRRRRQQILLPFH